MKNTTTKILRGITFPIVLPLNLLGTAIVYLAVLPFMTAKLEWPRAVLVLIGIPFGFLLGIGMNLRTLSYVLHGVGFIQAGMNSSAVLSKRTVVRLHQWTFRVWTGGVLPDDEAENFASLTEALKAEATQ